MTPALRQAIRTALLDKMRGRKPAEVAMLAGVSPKTMRRLLSGRTFGSETVARVARVLRLNLDSIRPVEPQNPAEPSRTQQNPATLSPVVNWKQAALVLDVSEDTLRRARQRTGVTREPWWPSRQDCLEWYGGLAAKGW